MDPRRYVRPILGVAGAAHLAACVHAPLSTTDPDPPAIPAPPAPATLERAGESPPRGSPNGGPIPYLQAWGGMAPLIDGPKPAEPIAPVAPATASAPLAARTEDAMRVMAYAPGRIYSVRTAPLRVTSLSLEPGERLIDTAAGDTVRWQIGQTASGSGDDQRSLVLIKPLTAGLSTNLILTTSRRVYLVDLTSGAKAFDHAIAWSYPSVAEDSQTGRGDAGPAVAPGHARVPTDWTGATAYLVSAKGGRRPSWAPRAVFDDGQRTYIALAPDPNQGPTPLLFVLDENGRPSLANYRQAGSALIVDGLFEAAELRVGSGRSDVVRIVRQPREARR